MTTMAAPSCKRDRPTMAASSGPVFRLGELPDELSALVVDQMPLRSMARLALTHTHWAHSVQRSLHRFETWTKSYTKHRCCHDLTCEARALVAPEDTWSWHDHLHVLEAVAVRQHPAELVWLVEALIGSPWWEPRYFDEEAVGRAAARCLVGRRASGLAPETVQQFFEIFATHRNPEGTKIFCGGGPCGETHTTECGGFCVDNEMATRAWSFRALVKPLSAAGALGGSEAPAVGLCMSRASLSPNDAAFFLLNYIGAVWEMWDFTPEDASALAKLAVELRLDAPTVAALLSRLTEEEAAAQCGENAPLPSADFACTCTLLREWAIAAQFPTAWSTPDRSCILNSLALQAQRPGFKDAAGPVMCEVVKLTSPVITAAHAKTTCESSRAATSTRPGEERRCACACGSSGAR